MSQYMSTVENVRTVHQTDVRSLHFLTAEVSSPAHHYYFHRRFKKKPSITFTTDSPFTENLLKAPSSPTDLGV
jgi:hypothetical protein